MIIFLDVKLIGGLYFKHEWRCQIAIDEMKTTLEALHLCIQKAIKFENDHLYEFFIASSARSPERVSYEVMNGRCMETLASDMFPLSGNRKLFYWFDFGDDWMFQISCSSKSPEMAAPRLRYPRVVSEEGKKPVQYP
ncbi:hypothetical protein GCM10023116_21800 [Kistimonas scapharcae]|uniref:Plasmid pRiA4b Orf3-like domain-containing protein n=1 Tax=Kistimonas scapharcae TaxID=1036133 RepID=A0ABP8V1L6_9GAMM